MIEDFIVKESQKLSTQFQFLIKKEWMNYLKPKIVTEKENNKLRKWYESFSI